MMFIYSLVLSQLLPGRFFVPVVVRGGSNLPTPKFLTTHEHYSCRRDLTGSAVWKLGGF